MFVVNCFGYIFWSLYQEICLSRSLNDCPSCDLHPTVRKIVRVNFALYSDISMKIVVYDSSDYIG